MQKNKSGIKKFIVLLIFILLSIVAVGVVYVMGRPYISSVFGNSSIISVQSNRTIYQNITTTNITNPGKYGLWDFMTWAVVGVAGFVLLGYLASLLFRFLMSRQLIGDKSKKKCAEAAVNELRKDGYDVRFEEPKQSWRWFGGDISDNPAWTFVFLLGQTNPEDKITSMSRYNMVSCNVDAKTLAVWNEQTGKDIDDLKIEMNNIRFGREARPDFPGKTERPADIWADLFEHNKPNISLPIGQNETDE